ncbi:hypothetical protein AMAG_16298 [Allomyces macrogynus ATCC 38327]|uniref:Uncharacterized protein n=1 Tax=Allomyces macrogynus (strain ATCC 38327) TaxID=578462 RepID=A0A0L0TBA6_ALLM3|nr:hypothetical protein AMAG_16298 [Allomyces macrogynus ATCC 38327]|eukprot:KNE71869.1 hypothetical protein AMAG_16298 [Allomyces macrogynus ATCC 38327]
MCPRCALRSPYFLDNYKRKPCAHKPEREPSDNESDSNDPDWIDFCTLNRWLERLLHEAYAGDLNRVEGEVDRIQIETLLEVVDRVDTLLPEHGYDYDIMDYLSFAWPTYRTAHDEDVAELMLALHALKLG